MYESFMANVHEGLARYQVQVTAQQSAEQMLILTRQGAYVCITKEQCMAFFGLVEAPVAEPEEESSYAKSYRLLQERAEASDEPEEFHARLERKYMQSLAVDDAAKLLVDSFNKRREAYREKVANASTPKLKLGQLYDQLMELHQAVKASPYPGRGSIEAHLRDQDVSL